MDRWQNRVAVVTGASVGIGAAIVKDLLKAGVIVVGLARRKELIEEYREKLPVEQQKRLHAVRVSLSSRESVNEAFDWTIKQFGGVDILINNAGTFVAGQLATMDLVDVEQTVLVNVLGLIYATQRAVKSIKERNVEGHVVNINSALGHSIPAPPGGLPPQYNVYPATKFAVTAISEMLRQEFVGQAAGKVKVTSVSPGLTDTDLVPDQIRSQVQVILKPEDVSEAVLFVLSTPQRVLISELTVRPNQ